MVAIVCHDAGGAEILSNWILSNSEPYVLVLDGPAIKIFSNYISQVSILDLEYAIEISDWVLCGTSWQSDLEKLAIVCAKKKKKKVISFLDHWVNYKERFVLNTNPILPDEIWVGDKYAKILASKIFRKIKIRQVDNPYFDRIVKEFDSFSSPINNSVLLYLCEPIAAHANIQYNNENYLGYTEFDALEYFLNYVEIIQPFFSKIIIRPHPSECASKYDSVLMYNDKIEISSKSLFEDIKESSVLIGCETMALIVGVLAKKRVISCIPPGGKPCRLPHIEIESLQNLINFSNDL